MPISRIKLLPTALLLLVRRTTAESQVRGRLKSACAASAASAPMNVVARRGLFGLLLSLFILLLRQSAECSPLFLSSSRCLPFPVTVSSTHMSIICRSCLPAIHHCCLEMLSRPLTWLSEHLRALSGLPVIVQSSAVRVYQPTFRSCLPALRHCLPALHRCLEMLSRPLSWLSEHLRALSGLPVIVHSSALRVYPLLTFNPSLVLVSCRACMLPWSF